MSDSKIWNDVTRQELRDAIHARILGEIRLTRLDHDAILEYCQSMIDDECSEPERDEFYQFASHEFERVAQQCKAEQATWPEETDSDRLDRVGETLREKGILLWQASPCCDTCTLAELRDRVDAISIDDPQFKDRMRGYAFFIDQSLPEMLAEDTNVSVYFGYGMASENEDMSKEKYEEGSLAIAHEICQHLREEGFEVDWNGDYSKKFCISLNWRRRTLLD